MSRVVATVKLFHDDDRTGQLLVDYSSEDDFMTVSNDGEGFTIKTENWLKLVEMAATLLATERIPYDERKV